MADRNGYIGRAPGDSSITIARKTYEPTGVQTDFTFDAGYDPGYCDVYLNGSRLISGNDYTASNGSTVGLTSEAQSGDIIEIVAYKAFNLGVPLSDITGDLDVTGNISASSSITAGTFYGSGSGLTGVASTDYIITGTAATFNSQVKVLNLNVTGITSTTTFNVGSATTIDGGGINVTGVITATSFVGDGSALTGVANTEYVVSVATTTGDLKVSAAATIGGAVNIDATTDSTSTSTGALIVDGGVGIAKNVYIGAGLSVAGTLTYEDVTNVDSVGVVTAKSGVNISGGELLVGTAVTVGSAGVSTFTGAVHVENNLKLSHGYSLLLENGFKNETSSIVNDGATDKGTIVFKSSDGGTLTERLRIKDSGEVVVAANSRLEVATAAQLLVGSGITMSATSGVVTFANGSTTTNALHFGSPAELKIYHDGGNHYIRGEGDGLLSVRQMGTGDVELFSNMDARIRVNGGETAIECNLNSSVDLYHNNNKKLETTSSGVSVTGTVAATNFTGDGSNLTGISAGMSTSVSTAAGIVSTLALSDAQDHKVTVSGITTFTCNGGTEGDTHTLRIINSGITTIGFSTYFLFPSGSAPSIPTADGTVSLISFTVHRQGGSAGITTQLLAGASLNFS